MNERKVCKYQAFLFTLFIHYFLIKLQGFLLSFRICKPMAPFLYEEMYMILQSLMKRFVKNDIMKHTIIKVIESMYILLIADLNSGFAAKCSLQERKL